MAKPLIRLSVRYPLTILRRLLLPIALLATAAVLLSAAVPSAYACSCAALTARQHIENADVIAIGKVIRLNETSEQFPPVEGKSDGAVPDLDAVVLVQRYLKGDGPTEIAVDDPPSGGACGFLEEASLGETYLLFLKGQSSPFETNICAGSGQLAGEARDQQFLEEVVAITGRGAAPEEHFPWVIVGVGAGLGGALLVGASALLLRRRIMARG